MLGRKPRPPEHLSFSSRETLLRCAKSYFLQKIAGAPQWPALWLAGGSAVHEVTEAYDHWAVSPWSDAFNTELAWQTSYNDQLAQLDEREPNRHAWRQSSSEPVETWRTMGLDFVRAYVAWRQRSPWEIWTTPDGQPAIELDVSGMLPGCPVEIKGYIDRVFWDPTFEKLWVLDLKSGKRPPKSPAQFGTYAALLKAKYGVDVDDGVAFMNRKATLGKPFDLSLYDPEYVGRLYGEAWEQIERSLETGEWPANGYDKECYICDMSASCFAKRGPLSARFDPADPEYAPPF